MSFLYGVSGFSQRDGARSSVIYKGLRVGPGKVMGCLIRTPPLGRFSGTSKAKRREDRWRGHVSQLSWEGLRRAGQRGRLRGTSGLFCILLPPVEKEWMYTRPRYI